MHIRIPVAYGELLKLKRRLKRPQIVMQVPSNRANEKPSRVAACR